MNKFQRGEVVRYKLPKVGHLIIVDVVFRMPWQKYTRYNVHRWNKDTQRLDSGTVFEYEIIKLYE